jgi:OFA family oxalate/formate antiporter-like MFS transporter
MLTATAEPHADADDASLPSRWLIAASAFCMQLALGSVYAWSVLLDPLAELHGATRGQVGLTFTVTLAVVGITVGFGGVLHNRRGPRAMATAAGLLYGSGVLLSGFAPNVPTLYLTYGVLGGIGLGLGYIVPLAMLIRWFPDRRGCITGLAVAGFGLGALLTGPAATWATAAVGVQWALVGLGAAYLAVVTTAAQFFRAAPDNYAPAGWTPRTGVATARAARDHSLAEALRSPRWWLLWCILALNVTAGAALLSVAAPLAREFTLADATAAALFVGALSVCNGIGRVFWGAVSDAVGRPPALLAMFLLQALAFARLAGAADFGAALVLAGVIAACFGGGFAVMPAFAADVFGARNAGTVYGAMLTAWSAGAIAGPVLIANVPYRTALLVIAAGAAASAALPLFAGRLVRGAAAPAAGLVHPSPGSVSFLRVRSGSAI